MIVPFLEDLLFVAFTSIPLWMGTAFWDSFLFLKYTGNDFSGLPDTRPHLKSERLRARPGLGPDLPVSVGLRAWWGLSEDLPSWTGVRQVLHGICYGPGGVHGL